MSINKTTMAKGSDRVRFLRACARLAGIDNAVATSRKGSDRARFLRACARVAEVPAARRRVSRAVRQAFRIDGFMARRAHVVAAIRAAR